MGIGAVFCLLSCALAARKHRSGLPLGNRTATHRVMDISERRADFPAGKYELSTHSKVRRGPALTSAELGGLSKFKKVDLLETQNLKGKVRARVAWQHNSGWITVKDLSTGKRFATPVVNKPRRRSQSPSSRFLMPPGAPSHSKTGGIPSKTGGTPNRYIHALGGTWKRGTGIR